MTLEAKRAGRFVQRGADMAPVGLVAAVELDRGPADLGQHVRHRAAAVAAAPAVDQRLPVARLVGERGFHVLRDVARHQRRA